MRNLRMAFTAILLALFGPSVSRAQQAANWRDSSIRLHQAVKALRDSMITGDSNLAEVARRGDLIIASSSNQRTAAAEALEKFGQMRDRWFGNVMPSPNGFRILLRTEDYGDAPREGDRRTGNIILVGQPDTGTSPRSSGTVRPGELTQQLIDRFGEMLFRTTTPLLTGWLGGVPPLSLPDNERRDQAMYAVVTGTGPAQRHCVNGDLAECERALLITQAVAADPGGPFHSFVRADLFLTALEVGGPQAWSRSQRADNHTIAEVLARTAGIPVDSLVSRWRGGLMARRPNAAPLSGTAAFLAITWSALLLAGALGASRWT